jgi:hypothetical protein
MKGDSEESTPFGVTLDEELLLFIFKVKDLSVFVYWHVPIPSSWSISTSQRAE